jgi:sec-independent protein translocase protein TatB
MFDLAWSEIALIAVVAVVVIGPKDLPDAVRGVARMVRKARQMASEFRGQADELVREANLHEVRDSLNEIRNFNVRDTFEKAVDGDGTLRKTFEEDPLRDHPHTTYGADSTAGAGVDAFSDSVAGADSIAGAEPPAFVPPESTHRAEAAPPPAAPEVPAFIPPGHVPPAGAPTHNT